MTSASSEGASCRRIVVASPIEPSGASWLLNCFLELNIRIDHKPVVDRVWRGSAAPASPDRMWTATDGGNMRLNPKAAVLMKFLPALARPDDFQFRGDVRVDYVQDFPPREIDDARDFCNTILMVRDPGDAIYSSYRRAAPALSFAEYLRFLNPHTLLHRAAHWTLFMAAWLAVPHIHVVRFEDYKRDATATLREALNALGLHYIDEDIDRAVRLSSFEHARAVEHAVNSKVGQDHQVANRSSKVGEAREQTEVVAALPAIEAAAAPVLGALRYAPVEPRDNFAAARLNAAFLSFFDNVRLPLAIAREPVDLAASEKVVFEVLRFAQSVDAAMLRRARLPPAEIRTLLDSLQAFSRGYSEALGAGLAATRARFGDGSGYFFDLIKDMRKGKKGLML